MRKQFEVRARCVIYMEQRDLNRLTALAREEGKTLVDWARATLLDRLAGPGARGGGSGATPEKRHRPRTRSTIRAIEDVAHAATRKLASGMAEVPRIAEREGVCPHGKSAGAVCGKCDPKMGWPRVG